MLIQSFSVKGFLGKKDVHITFNDLLKLENGEEKQVKILVGENGIGKTQLLNMFYYTLTQDFFKLAEFNFDTIKLVLTNNEIINIDRNDIITRIIKVYKNINFKNFVQNVGYADWLLLLDDAKQHTNDKIKTIALIQKYEKKYAIYKDINIKLLLSFAQKLEEDTHETTINNSKNKLGNFFAKNDLIFFPTYRRIEQDIYNFRHFDYSFDTEIANDETKKDLIIQDLVIKFGMYDIQNQFERIQEKITKIIKSSTAVLLSDILTLALESASTDNQDEIWQIVTERDMEIILARVDSSLQKNHVAALKKAFKEKKLPNPFLGSLLQKLIAIYRQQQPYDDLIKKYQAVCNKYLIDKEVYYDETLIDIYIRFTDESKEKIELSQLSSGEKQIISIFAKLYLSFSEKQYLLLFDEPELSLSIIWQRQLLPDIMASGKCDFLLAVTHSPSIFRDLPNYGHSLKEYMTTNIAQQ